MVILVRRLAIRLRPPELLVEYSDEAPAGPPAPGFAPYRERERERERSPNAACS